MWRDRGGPAIEILPLILQPENSHRLDVATNVPLPGSIVRPTPLTVSARNYIAYGELPGEVQCAVSRAVALNYAEQMSLSRWAGDRAHKQRAAEPIRLAV